MNHDKLSVIEDFESPALTVPRCIIEDDKKIILEVVAQALFRDKKLLAVATSDNQIRILDVLNEAKAIKRVRLSDLLANENHFVKVLAMVTCKDSLVVATDDKCMRAFSLNSILKMSDSIAPKAQKKKRIALTTDN